MALRNPEVARLATVGTVVEAVFTKPDAEIALAQIAKFVAGAGALRQVALHADDFFASHGALHADYIPRGTWRQDAIYPRASTRNRARFLDTLWSACYFRLLAAIAETLL
jgi:hypothetical protein